MDVFLLKKIYIYFGMLLSFLLSTTRRISPKYGEIQSGMYFFCIHRRPGTMDNECEELPVFQQYLGKYATYKYV